MPGVIHGLDRDRYTSETPPLPRLTGAAPATNGAASPRDSIDDEVSARGPTGTWLEAPVHEAAVPGGDPPRVQSRAYHGDTADDDTFLEEEDSGDDDVADLIDGDIENDEEG